MSPEWPRGSGALTDYTLLHAREGRERREARSTLAPRRQELLTEATTDNSQGSSFRFCKIRTSSQVQTSDFPHTLHWRELHKAGEGDHGTETWVQAPDRSDLVNLSLICKRVAW